MTKEPDTASVQTDRHLGLVAMFANATIVYRRVGDLMQMQSEKHAPNAEEPTRLDSQTSMGIAAYVMVN